MYIIMILYWILFVLITLIYGHHKKKVMSQLPEYSEEALFVKNLAPYKTIFPKVILQKITGNQYQKILEQNITVTRNYFLAIIIITIIALIFLSFYYFNVISIITSAPT